MNIKNVSKPLGMNSLPNFRGFILARNTVNIKGRGMIFHHGLTFVQQHSIQYWRETH